MKYPGPGETIRRCPNGSKRRVVRSDSDFRASPELKLRSYRARLQSSASFNDKCLSELIKNMDRVYNKAYIRGAEYNWTVPYFANVQVPFIKGKTFESHTITFYRVINQIHLQRMSSTLYGNSDPV